MHHQFVSSSTLLSIGYEHPVLEVRFKHGGCYQYHGVPEGVYRELLNAPSKGRYLHYQIKPFYPCYKVF
ncbi:KTSC domain-containing protein [Eikenella sp. NML99-0057]|uniref:KTSC domain-containing protein n=1 Tax=Eikenella sp. NML99-0057 TaxID=1795834 RepID=UPI0009EF5DB8|nr:KTSC domain-containing protein [Eikenella sp. NML99-0057]